MAPVRPFQIDPALTAIAIGYSNPDVTLIADEVLPRVDVMSEKFKWTRYPLEEGFTVPQTRVGRKGAVARVSFSGTEVPDEIEDYGLEDQIPYSDIQEAERQRAMNRSLFDPRNRSVEMLTNLLKLDREVRVANTVFALGTYAANRRVTLSGASQLSAYATSDPLGVFSAALDGTLVHRPNTVVIGQAVWSVVRRHPKLVNAVKGNLTNEGMITREQLAELLEVKRVLVGEGFVNVARKGQEASLARVWGKHVAFLYLDRAAAQTQGVTFGMTAQLGSRLAGAWEDKNIGLQGGETVRVGERVKELIVAQDVGYFLQNAVA